MPQQPNEISYDRFGGMNSRNAPEQLDVNRSQVAINLAFGRSTARSRLGFKKATVEPVWGRSLELRGVETGIVSTKLPEAAGDWWDDSVASGTDSTRVTFQIRCKGSGLDAIPQTDVPYSLDYAGHGKPNRGSALELGDTIFYNTTASMGFESADPQLWKPANPNNYDGTVGVHFPWLPNIQSVTAGAPDPTEATSGLRPKLSCVFGTGPLREFPLVYGDFSQRTWSITGGGRLTQMFEPVTGAYAARLPTLLDADIVSQGHFDPGDLYVFWVKNPVDQGWYLMVLWEYSDPGYHGSLPLAIPHNQGMNRMFAFVGWGDTSVHNRQAVALDPNVAHTITVTLKRDFAQAAQSELGIYVDDPFDGSVTAEDRYGLVKAVPLPGGGPGGVGDEPSAPLFGIDQVCGRNPTPSANSMSRSGRAIYVGGLPKATNQRGAWGLGCGKSIQRGGMIGVTCPYYGLVSEFRLYCGEFAFTGGSRDIAATAKLAPYSSRTIKHLAGGADWNAAGVPGAPKYTGCMNIWRLDEERLDTFEPLYTWRGLGFAASGPPATLAQDWHAFSCVNNGCMVAPGPVIGQGGDVVMEAAGVMRFNGGSPAFTLQGARYRKSGGEEATNAEDFFTGGKLRPPDEFSLALAYKVVVAPQTEPLSAAGDGGHTPYPQGGKPFIGEVHTLAQVMSPNRQGKDDDVPIKYPVGSGGETYHDITLGQDQGIPEGYDHPDTIWDGWTYATPGLWDYLASGKKNLEIARIDLVAHWVDTTGAGNMQRRYAIRSDFGFGATRGDYKFTDTTTNEHAQQHGNERMFRSSLDYAVPAPMEPADVDDDHWTPNAVPASSDDRYCYVWLCDSLGAFFDVPSEIEGRVYAIEAGFSQNTAVSDAAEVTGQQHLRVWDITDPANIFALHDVAPSSRAVAECGLSHAATKLFGVDKYVVNFGGKLPCQSSEWWISDDFHLRGADSDAYPYGCFAVSSSADTRSDKASMALSGGAVLNGAKGDIPMACIFKKSLSESAALAAFQAFIDSSGFALTPPAAFADAVGGSASSLWLCDAESGPVVADPEGGVTLGLDERIAIVLPTGGTQVYTALNDDFFADTSPEAVDAKRNLPYTYNAIPSDAAFPQAIVPVKVIHTGRGDSLYGSDEFSETIAALTLEPTNVTPSAEELLAALQHTGSRADTRILAASAASVFAYDPSGSGALDRIGSLPSHFSPAHAVSRDSLGDRAVITNGGAGPVVIDGNGDVTGREFIEAPAYGTPEMWARNFRVTGTTPTGYVFLEPIPLASEWPFVFPVSWETSFPRTDATIGIERIESADGLRWLGEMPSIAIKTDAALDPGGYPINGLATSPPTDLVQWAFFFTYWSERKQVESQPGRTFIWSNVMPLRAPRHGGYLGYTSGSSGDDTHTGEPKTDETVLVMRGLTPADYYSFIKEAVNGKPEAYNLRIRNVPLSSNPDVTHLRVYRTSVNGSVFFLEQEIAIPSGGDANDDHITVVVGIVPDAALTTPHQGGIASFPPIGARFTATYGGRVFYGGFAWAPSRLYASYVDRPTSVPFFYFVDVGGANSGPLTGLFVDRDRLMAYKEGAVYVVNSRAWDIFDFNSIGQGLPFEVSMAVQQSGAVGDRAIVSIPQRGIVFAGDSSVYLQTDLAMTPLSAAIDVVDESHHVSVTPADGLAVSRPGYPYSLDASSRRRWTAVYEPKERLVLLSDGASPQQLAFFVDSAEWAAWTHYGFTDMELVSRYDSESVELWGVKDSRLWKLLVGQSDGTDYSCDALAATHALNGAASVLEGAVAIAVSTTVLTLSTQLANLPAALQALVGGSVDRRGKDLWRGTSILLHTASGRVEGTIARTRTSGPALQVVLESAVAGVAAGNAFAIGAIEAAWIGGRAKPALGVESHEPLRLDLQKTPVAGPGGLRGALEVYLANDSDWPVAADLRRTFTGGVGDRLSLTALHGRGRSSLVAFRGGGPYRPIEVVRGTLKTNPLASQGFLSDGS